MNLLKVILFFYLISILITGFAQTRTDSVKQLGIIEISASRSIAFSSGNKSETIDSTIINRYSTNNLADLLANESQVFIKSYGLGSSATSSFRGAGASHTAVLWNGFNIQNPMLAQLDISLVPANFLNEVKLQYGGSGALWGTGAVGGTILLNNQTQYNKGITVSATTSFGSFSDQQQQVNIEISKKRFISSIKLFNHDAKNDFSFINTAQYGKPEQKQSHGELKQYGILQENYYQINLRQKINTRVWYQFNDRNISPSMTQVISRSNQKDKFYRLTSEWQRTGEKVKLFARAAYFDEYLYFVDSAINEDSKSRSKVAIMEVEGRFSVSKYDLVNVGINNTYSEAKTADYIYSPYQNRIGIFASYKIHNKKDTWSSVISARQEFVKGTAVPFTASLGMEGQLLKSVQLKGNVSKHYRLPSFNDVYWAGQAAQGNPDLKPESGWSEELGLTHKYNFKKMDWELDATAFNRDINNWIIWLPNQYNTWSPENMLEVWSRGLEYKVKVGYTSNKLKIQLSGMYNYILSTNEKQATANDLSFHKQLIYVPIQNGQCGISISFKGTTIVYTQVYTGYRYTTSDNLHFLKPYTIGNARIEQVLKIKTSRLKIYLQLNNIWKETYQVIAYRAMPLFNYQFGLTFYFNKQNN
ncbi:MAG: TonB-dependent receptor plug domain-containing protein [Bacteroidota bacterium]